MKRFARRIPCALVLVAASGVAAAPEARADLRDPAAIARLAAAVEALEGDPSQSERLLVELLADPAPIEDHLLLLQGSARTRLGDAAGARDVFVRLLATHPGSPVAPAAAALLAPSLLDAGEADAVVRLAERYATVGNSDEAAAIALAAGKALADTRPRAASVWLMRARRSAPGGRAGAEAASLLSDLRRFTPELRPTSADELLDEARLAAREGDVAAVVTLTDALLARHASDPRATDAVLLRAGRVAADEGRPEAAAWLEKRAERAPTRAARARLLYAAATHRWNADDTPAARAGFLRVVALDASPNEKQRSLYALGRIAESDRRYTDAADAYLGAAAGPVPEVARESRWRAGWAAYLSGDYELAERRFARIATDPRAEDAAREEALYWQGRTLERANRADEAQAAYLRVLEEFPDGFYAAHAERRSGRSAAAPSVVKIAADDRTLPEHLRVLLERARILEAAGLRSYATLEIRSAADTPDAANRRALLPHLVEVGAFEQALSVALALYRAGALTENELYPYLYPHAFADVVEREARARGLDPFLVYSLIRQESLFDRRAVSPASAYGLMQLLLPTARRMAAQEADVPYVERDDLFRPDVNVRLGTAYLADLGRRFDNDEVFMLAGYNAGEQAAERWKARFAGLERDELIEQITYRETRDYVKKVLRNYRNYRRLYGGDRGTAADAAAASLRDG